ncbi:MAG: 5-formyltetrahydrofolate cyclo-ligase [Actinomycetes bacterium]
MQPLSDPSPRAAAKAALRRTLRAGRDRRSPAVRAADDAARTEVLLGRLPDRPGCLAAYVSAGSEPGTGRLLDRLVAAGWRVLLPVLTDGERWLPDPAWAPYAGPADLRIGRAGIREPSGPAGAPRTLGDAELVVCPGLAGDLAGHRLGRGGGWYDRALAAASADALVVVLLNDAEVLPAVPYEAWDRSVHALVTPSGWRDCRAPASG